MDIRKRIDGIDIIASDDEIWFVQDGRVCWTTRAEVWSDSLRLGEVLRKKGYTLQPRSFPKKLRELVLSISRPSGSVSSASPAE